LRKIEKILEESLRAKCRVVESMMVVNVESRRELCDILAMLRVGWCFAGLEKPWLIEALCKMKEITPLKAVSSLRAVCKSWYYLVKPSFDTLSPISKHYLYQKKTIPQEILLPIPPFPAPPEFHHC